MRCNGCVQSLQRALAEISGVSEAEVILDQGLAKIRGRGFDNDLLHEAVDSLGFSVETTRGL